ncbi:hypothetical protein [Novosphingobium resinovorum]|uniref:hypothetical protein n=1 Tax=Novosphingobium resinovorum TaxID=158500 RepID=UPI003AF3972E
MQACDLIIEATGKALDAQSASKQLCACCKGVTFWSGVRVSFWSPSRRSMS